VAAHDLRWGATQLRLAAEATTSGVRRGANEGMNRGFASPGLGQSGWQEWALRWKRKREGKRKGKWAARVSTQNSLGGKKSFSIFKMLYEFPNQFEF
jgi:hypothetical protein